MKTLYVYFLISLYLFCNLAHSQNNNKSPQLKHTDGYIDYYDFPAISKNGGLVALIKKEYSCCVETDVVLEIYVTKTNKLQTSILLYASPDLGNFKNFSKEIQKKNIEKANRYLSKQKYISLKLIRDFEQKNKSNSDKIHLEIPYKGNRLKSQSFTLPMFSLSSFCCTGEYDSTTPCNRKGTINNLWLDENLRYLIVESGVHHAADGCDSGPEFLIVWLFK